MERVASSYQLDITAKVTLTIGAGGKALKVPVLIQPLSQQPCLLGMNVAPDLGVCFLDAYGKALYKTATPTTMLLC